MSIPWVGVAAGAGAALVGPAIMPVVGSGLKFVAKNVIKGGLVAYSGTITFFHQTTKSFEDLSSEARSELANSKKQEPEKKSKSRTTQQKAKTSTSEK